MVHRDTSSAVPWVASQVYTAHLHLELLGYSAQIQVRGKADMDASYLGYPPRTPYLGTPHLGSSCVGPSHAHLGIFSPGTSYLGIFT